ncbi:MAG: hypothetical protein J0L92_01045 [Deltaproteobacteria bacterium]|nr:hypothetical protein [Deltaproteobacteria bacterium]
MSRLKAGGLTGSQAFKDLRDKADALKKSIGASQQEFLQLGGSLASLKPDKAAGGLEDLLGSLTKLPGPLGQGASKLGALFSGSSMAMLGLAGLAAGVVAVVAVLATLVSAVGQAALALAQYGLAAADARRNELLHLEGLVSIRSWYTRAAGSATELQQSIDAVSGSAAISRSRVAGYAEQLYRAGLRGQTLEDALRGVSTVAAVQGEGMADRFRAMAIGAARTGRSVRGLADDVEHRLGGTARRMGLSWDRQIERMHESWAGLFSGIELDGALGALDEVLRIFSQTTVTGRALRTMLSALFQPLLDGVSDVGSPIREFFEGVILQTQRIVIAILRARNAMVRTFGGSASGLSDFVSWTTLGQVAVGTLAISLLGAVAVVGLLAAALGSIVLVVGAVGYAFVRFGMGVTQMYERLSGTDWRTLGRSLIDGLVGGLMGRASEAWKAVTTIGTGMTEALRTALDIRSPSRVFAELGRQIPRGLAVGVEAEASVSTSAIDGLANVPQGGAVGATSGRGGVGAVYVSIDGINLTVSSADQLPTNIGERLREEIERVFIGVLAETGGADA